MTIFIVNGKEKEVLMMINGIDQSGDFIGNTHHGMDTNDEGNYLASQEDYDWWLETIDAHLQMDELIDKYKEEHDADQVDKVVQDNMSCDMEDQPSRVALGLEEIFGSLQ